MVGERMGISVSNFPKDKKAPRNSITMDKNDEDVVCNDDISGSIGLVVGRAICRCMGGFGISRVAKIRWETDSAVIPGKGTPDGVGAWAISAMEGSQRKIE